MSFFEFVVRWIFTYKVLHGRLLDLVLPHLIKVGHQELSQLKPEPWLFLKHRSGVFSHNFVELRLLGFRLGIKLIFA